MPARHSYDRRGMPDDFAAVAPGKGVKALARHYSCGQTTARRWLIEAGLYQPRAYTMGLPENIAELAQTYSIADIARMIGADRCTVSMKLIRKHPDLHKLAKANGERQAHEGRARALATMKANAAKRRAEREAAMAAERAANPKPAKRMPLSASGKRNAVVVPDRQETQADQARAYLQRFGPCFSRKVYNRILDDYSFLGRVLTPAQLIAEAQRRGWQPDAWRQAA